MGALRLALAQINPSIGDFEGNERKIAAAIRHARERAVDVAVFPELAVCGYPPEDLLLRPRFLDDTRSSFERLVEETAGITVVAGFADASDGNVYNAAGVLCDRRLVGIYHKIELPNYGVFDEERYFTRGHRPLLLEANDTRLFLTICEDIWVEGGVVEKSSTDTQPDIVLNISGSPFHAGKFEARCAVISRFAKHTGAFVCYTNVVGGQGELVFDGGSMVVDPSGRVVARAKRFEEDVLIFDVESPTAGERHMSPGRDSDSVSIETRDHGDRANVPRRPPPELGQVEEIYRALVLGTRDYVRKSGFEKVVIGLSGGVDSSLTAAIAVDALGDDNVIGVTMPSAYTSDETLTDAQILAENLKIRLITVPVREIFGAYVDTLQGPLDGCEEGVAVENIQARIRGNILMALSNKFGWLVLTTGNKSETAVGYCTLYGDMAGGFAVIKDVPKTLVYELSDHVNEKADREVIPRTVLVRAPSAELRPDQKDQDTLPPYEVLDPILQRYVELDKAPDEIVADGFSADVVDYVVGMVDRNEYKRRQAPPGVKITPKAFGKDRRFPVANLYRPRSG